MNKVADMTPETIKKLVDSGKTGDEEFRKMCKWMGQGEMDVDLALRMGAVSKEQIVEMCHVLTDSPWFKKVPK